MSKIDFKKTMAKFYRPTARKFSVVEMPKQKFLMIDGKGAPGNADYSDALEALYPMAYTLKFMSKMYCDQDYVVPPLEGLWWAEDMDAFVEDNRDEWLWTMMIMLPDWITTDMFEEAKTKVKSKSNPAALANIRMGETDEGTCVQILHIGPYSEEGPVIDKMHNEFMPANGFAPHKKHHEIYLSDPRRTVAEKLKTVIRQPVKAV